MSYRLPYVRTQDVYAWAGWATGVYDVENVGGMSYVHTDGDASVRLPETGVGTFAVDLWLGGPGGIAPVPARLEVDDETVDLATVAEPRWYHLLAPTNAQGDVEMDIHSPTIQPARDQRQLGVQIDWIRLRSLSLEAPPLSLVAAATLCLTLLTFVLTVLGVRRRVRLILLVTAAVLLGLAPLIYRGQVALTPWLIGLSLAAVAGLGLAKADGVAFLGSLPGVATTVAVWRVALWLVGGAALWWSEVVNQYGGGLANFGVVWSRQGALISHALGRAWMQWDSLHYEAIATSGYTFQGAEWPSIAFFPLYPMLIRLLMPLVGGSTMIAAIAISNLALLGAVLLLYNMLARDVGRVAAYRSVLLLLLFPTAFYLGAGYTESLALFLTAGAIWTCRRERWWLAGATGFLLALTRVPGVFVAPIIAVAYLQSHRWRWRSILRQPFLAVFLPPLGLLGFMAYQWFAWGTPFAFLVAQQSWDNGMAAPWAMPVKLLKAVWTSPRWELATVQLVVWLSFIGLTVLALRRLPLVYGLTAALLLLPAFLANQWGSLIRHVLIGFPVFVMLALLAERLWLRWLVFSLMVPLLVVLTALFVNGFGLF